MTEETLDRLVDKMTVDLCTTGLPDPVDVLRWALERWPELKTGEPINRGDLAEWFINDYVPVVRAALCQVGQES